MVHFPLPCFITGGYFHPSSRPSSHLVPFNINARFRRGIEGRPQPWGSQGGYEASEVSDGNISKIRWHTNDAYIYIYICVMSVYVCADTLNISRYCIYIIYGYNIYIYIYIYSILWYPNLGHSEDIPNQGILKQWSYPIPWCRVPGITARRIGPSMMHLCSGDVLGYHGIQASPRHWLVLN